MGVAFAETGKAYPRERFLCDSGAFARAEVRQSESDVLANVIVWEQYMILKYHSDRA
tara:strand:- start:344 stop:514 length:171 start_codon:yes stop_codon:yes gene_type:complete